jgi:hypothetical protein
MFGLFSKKQRANLTEVQERALAMQRVTKRGRPIPGEDQRRLAAAELGRHRGQLIGGYVFASAAMGLAALGAGTPDLGLDFVAGFNRDFLGGARFFDGKALNAVSVALVQGLVLCLAAALLPMLVTLWARLRDNAHGNRYVTFWGVTIAAPLTWFFVADFFGPLLVSLVEGFM